MDILEETASCIRAPLDEEPRHLSYLRLFYTVGYGAEINMIHGQSHLFKPLYFDYKMGLMAAFSPGYGILPYVTSSVRRIPKLQTSDFMLNLL